MPVKKFSDEEITKGFKEIEGWLAQLSIMAAIIKPYYFEYIVKNAQSFDWMLKEFVFHMFGQVDRCWFDRANKDYKTISVCELYEQVKLSKKFEKASVNWKKKFSNMDKQKHVIKRKFENKMRTLAGKYYAHREVRSDEQKLKEYEGVKIGWGDLEKLIKSAKKIINSLLIFWEDRQANFEEPKYKYFRDNFWSVIKPSVLEVRSRSSKK